MATAKKTAIVSKKVTDEIVANAARWTSFLQASGLPFEDLSESWWNFFEAQSKPDTASVQLVKLVDRAIAKDLEKVE